MHISLQIAESSWFFSPVRGLEMTIPFGGWVGFFLGRSHQAFVEGLLEVRRLAGPWTETQYKLGHLGMLLSFPAIKGLNGVGDARPNNLYSLGNRIDISWSASRLFFLAFEGIHELPNTANLNVFPTIFQNKPPSSSHM